MLTVDHLLTLRLVRDYQVSSLKEPHLQDAVDALLIVCRRVLMSYDGLIIHPPPSLNEAITTGNVKVRDVMRDIFE